MTRLALAAVSVLLALSPPAHGWEIPDVPEDRDWISDYERLISAEDTAAIHEMMGRAGQAHATAIMVVTIDRMAEYAEHGDSGRIEDLARTWFDTWEIGSEDYNTGILLLVAKGDRKARIELGAAWGERWNGYTQRVMDGRIVPAFKAGDFSGGIRAGVAGLETMASIGPDGEPPQPGLLEQVQGTELVRTIRAHQPLPMWLATLSLLAGVALCVLGIFNEEHRKLLLIAGGALILVGVSVWLLVLVGGAFSKGSGRGSSGFGGGGFSGGGGATGSW